MLIFFKRVTTRLLTSIFLLISLPACGLSGDVIDGQVLDETTNKPVADAIVVVLWQGNDGSSLVHSQTVCYHVETAITGDQGKYHIPTWSDGSLRQNLSINHRYVTKVAYKAGYGWSEKEPPENTILLLPFTGTRRERFKYLFRVEQSIAACRGPEAGQRNLSLLYRALHEEAKSFAKSREELDFADGFLWQTEYLELGPEEADSRSRERTKQKDRQQLKRDSSALEGIMMKPGK